jgi:CO/xanthine dehydrogenase FAD-binding subunit
MKNFVGLRTLPDLIYHCPKDMENVLSLLKNIKGERRIIAGCTDFIPAIRRGAWHFGDGLNVIDIKGVDTLKKISKDGDNIRIGAATRLSDIVNSDIIRKYAPILSDAVNEMASLQIRNTGTIGGNLCTASPAADTAPPLLVLNAVVNVKGVDRDEVISLYDFFRGPSKTVLGDRDMLTEVIVPVMTVDERAKFIKLGRRVAATLSVVSVAVWTKIEGNTFKGIRIALGAVAPTPIRALKAETYLAGKEVRAEVIDEGAKIASDEIEPISDVRASEGYRRDMAHVLTRKAVDACVG